VPVAAGRGAGGSEPELQHARRYHAAFGDNDGNLRLRGLRHSKPGVYHGHTFSVPIVIVLTG
jgi:hypothetical protein